MSLVVLRAGPDCTLQDAGRPGYRDRGVPPSGVFDRSAARTSDAWVGNEGLSSVIEIGPFGAAFRATEPTCVGFSGALRTVKAGTRQSRGNGRLTLSRGEELTFGVVERGCRSYLAVPGGFQVRHILGSVSGAPLLVGDQLQAKATIDLPDAEGEPYRPSAIPIRVLSGPQAVLGLEGFLDQVWTVSPQADRRGIRLAGQLFIHQAPEARSTPQCLGVIQLPRGGEPIILGPDGPTLGGYPKIAVVVEADLDRLAQLLPGDPVRFQLAAG